MKRKGWYLVAYDIANPGRLKKIHNLMKKQGLAAQKSLFFVYGAESRINRLLDRIAILMVLKEDDLRAYPIDNPKKVWTNGPNPLAMFPVMHLGSEKTKPTIDRRKRLNWLKHILRLTRKSKNRGPKCLVIILTVKQKL